MSAQLETNDQMMLTAGTVALINELSERLSAGEAFDNPKLTEMAERNFGGSRARGTYCVKEAYDAQEVAVNKFLRDGAARDLLVQASVTDALTAHLRPLVARLARQTDRTHEQVELQQFSTPPTLAFLAARVLNPRAGETALEPSAGTGSLAIWLQAAGAHVIGNELNARRRALLQDVLGFETYGVDAEIIDDLLPAEIQPSAVLMNPPFSATGGRVAHHDTRYGARHIESALHRLADGGRLVAITGEGMALERPAFAE